MDSIVIGPNNLSADEVERVLGINTYLFKRSISRREELIRTKKRPKWWAGRGVDMYTILEHQQPEERSRRQSHSLTSKERSWSRASGADSLWTGGAVYSFLKIWVNWL